MLLNLALKYVFLFEENFLKLINFMLLKVNLILQLLVCIQNLKYLFINRQFLT